MQNSIDTENEKIKVTLNFCYAVDTFRELRTFLSSPGCVLCLRQDLQAQLTAKEAAVAERRISPSKRISMYTDEARDLVDAVAAVALGEREQNLMLMVNATQSCLHRCIFLRAL
jgi:hypothetical protein